jgi:acyl-CoA synthetase (AMP-forming)/AMP-acid ligase II
LQTRIAKAGYWDRPVETRETVAENGWLHTGDAARIDDEGFVWTVDRLADAFVASGHVVYPGDIERAAFVVLAPGAGVTEAELLEFSRAGPATGPIRNRERMSGASIEE